MTAPLFIGDEVSAAGYRLAGVRVRTPVADELVQVIDWASNNVSIIMITTAYMKQLPEPMREQLVKQEQPPVVVVPDIRSQAVFEDLAARFRQTLGILN